MATVSHGLLDSVDQVLEHLSSLSRQLEAHRTRADTSPVKRDAAFIAGSQVEQIKGMVTAMRINVEIVRRGGEAVSGE